MEEARRRIRICLVCIVMIAVIIGVVYYMNDVRDGGSPDEGTLVRQDISVDRDGYMCGTRQAEGRG